MELVPFSDASFMKEAYREALSAYKENEIPVGAVVVCNNKIIARGHNQTERLTDVTAHAEIIALTSAFNHLDSKYLPDCTLYVTLEPCIMCAGAIFWSQCGRLVYGASDPKQGFSRIQERILHPKTQITSGIMGKEAEQLLLDFFNKLRN